MTTASSRARPPRASTAAAARQDVVVGQWRNSRDVSATRSPASTESSWWQPSEHGVIMTHVTTRRTARPSCQDGDPPVAGVSSRVHRACDADHLLDTCLGWTEAEHAPRATRRSARAARPPRWRRDGDDGWPVTCTPNTRKLRCCRLDRMSRAGGGGARAASDPTIGPNCGRAKTAAYPRRRLVQGRARVGGPRRASLRGARRE